MKKILRFASIVSVSLLAACQSKEKPVFTGFWQGEDNMIFEVFQTEPGKNLYTIRNINGDLSAHIEGDSVLTGTNSLDMPFSMRVEKDSAFYLFGTIVSKYARIDEASYKELFKKLTPANVE